MPVRKDLIDYESPNYDYEYEEEVVDARKEDSLSEKGLVESARAASL